jgi:hypothetical protein
VPEKLPILEFRLTDHAQLEMERRHITDAEIARVLSAPEQTLMVRPGRVVYQSRVEFGEPPKTHLLRVFVDIDRQLPKVVTVYRTSKIEKYWRKKI